MRIGKFGFLNNFLPYFRLERELKKEESAMNTAVSGGQSVSESVSEDEGKGERVTHSAGAKSPTHLTVRKILGIIRASGKIPAERDTFYNILRVFA